MIVYSDVIDMHCLTSCAVKQNGNVAFLIHTYVFKEGNLDV